MPPTIANTFEQAQKYHREPARRQAILRSVPLKAGVREADIQEVGSHAVV